MFIRRYVLKVHFICLWKRVGRIDKKHIFNRVMGQFCIREKDVDTLVERVSQL